MPKQRSDLAMTFHEARQRKTQRQPNFSKEETLCALQGYSANQTLFRNQRGGKLTGDLKKTQWTEIARKVSLVEGVPRSATVVKSKVAAVRSKVKGPEAYRLFKLSLTGGGSPVETESENSTRGSQDSRRSEDTLNDDEDIDAKIKSIALSTLSKVQLVGFDGGMDLLKAKYQAEKASEQKQEGSLQGQRELTDVCLYKKFKLKLMGVFESLRNY